MKLNSILVLLYNPRPKGLFKIATELAHKTGAELKAVYLEDISWFEASSLSFSKQITGFRGEIMQFTEEQLTKQSQALAARFKKIFTTYSQSLRIRHSYHVIRGYNSDELASIIDETDLLVIPGNLRTAEYWNKLTEQISVPTLIWSNGTSWPKEVIGLCRFPEQSVELVQWTIQLAETINRRIRLFWDQNSNPSGERFDEVYTAQAVDPALSNAVREASEVYPSLSVDFLQHFRNAMLVVRRNEFETEYLLRDLPNSILLL